MKVAICSFKSVSFKIGRCMGHFVEDQVCQGSVVPFQHGRKNGVFQPSEGAVSLGGSKVGISPSCLGLLFPRAPALVKKPL